MIVQAGRGVHCSFQTVVHTNCNVDLRPRKDLTEAISPLQ